MKNDPYGLGKLDEPFFEAEVPPKKQPDFEKRYLQATGLKVSPKFPPEYQSQPNKRGPELRIYFNSEIVAVYLRFKRYNVTQGHPYKNKYRYRVSKNELWWELVEEHGFRLGANL